MIQCLFDIAERFCICGFEYEWENIKFNVYFDLVDSIYNKLCSKNSNLGPFEKVPNIKKEIKLLYQILQFAPSKSDGEGFRLESFLNFIERNWKVHMEIDPKLPVLDQKDIHAISNTLCCVIMKSRNVLSGSEVTRIFGMVNEFYFSKLFSASDLDEDRTATIASVVFTLNAAIKKGNVEKIQTNKVFNLADAIWSTFCSSKTDQKSEDLMSAVLLLIGSLLEKRNNSIDKANERLKSIGYVFADGTLEQIDRNTTEAFWANKKNHRNLVSGICKVYSSSELGEEIDNAAPPLIVSNHFENNSNNNDNDNNNINTEVKQNSSQAIKLNENEKKFKVIPLVENEINSNLVFGGNNDNVHSHIDTEQNISNNKKKEDEVNIIPEISSIKDISDCKVLGKSKNEIDNNYKSQYWFAVFSIIFKLFFFASLLVAIFLLILLLSSLASPIFAPILKTLIAKLIFLGVASITVLVTWKLSKTLKSKIPCNNSDSNKEIGEERLKEPYVIDKSKKIIPILDEQWLIGKNSRQLTVK